MSRRLAVIAKATFFVAEAISTRAFEQIASGGNASAFAMTTRAQV